MATDSMTVNCPSCDAKVTAKAASVGKKIECSRCKNRFILEQSPAMADSPKPKKGSKAAVVADDEDTPAPKKKGGKKAAAKAKGGGNTKVMVGALIGVLALAGLAIGAFVIFGGSDKNARTNPTTPANNNQQPAVNQNPNGPAPTGNSGEIVDETNLPKKDPDDQIPNTNPNPNGTGPAVNPPAGINPGPMGPDKSGGTGTENPKPTPPALPKNKFVDADLMNLLPGDAKTALHVRMDEVTKSATTLR